jgi:hypothetical protein
MKKILQLYNNRTKKRKNNAQMILLAGVMITVLVIVLSSISANLSNIGVGLSLERSISPREEYTNVRHIFINVFNNSCGGHNDTNIVWHAFNYTKNVLFDIEMRYGNYFDAELRNIDYYDEDALDVSVCLKLICKSTRIEEEIRIPIWIKI